MYIAIIIMTLVHNVAMYVLICMYAIGQHVNSVVTDLIKYTV